MPDHPSINRGASHTNNPSRTVEQTGGQPAANRAHATGDRAGHIQASERPALNAGATDTENPDSTRVENPDEEPEIGDDARIFEEQDMVNAAMLPDLFGYRSLGQNRDRIDEIENGVHEEP